MIYTVTLNPSLDYHVYASALSLDKTNRAEKTEMTYGGKGVNVSVILTRLGIPNIARGFVAGFTGEELCRRLTEEGLTHDMIRLEQGGTRINVKLHHGEETEINASGPLITAEAITVMMHKLEEMNRGDILVLSGSVPPSLPKSIYADMMCKTEKKGIRCVVDAEGEALTATLSYRPFLIKPNLRELSMLAGRELVGDDEIIAVARDLQARGAQNVLVSLGGRGAILLDADGGCHVSPAVHVVPVNTVGAGDSMVAGFLAGIPEGYGHALKMGLSCGGATAAAEGLATKEEIYALMGK